MRDNAGNGTMSTEEFRETVKPLREQHPDCDIDSPLVYQVDFVIGAVFEDMAIEQDTFAKLEARCRPDTIFCTNSNVSI